MPDTRPGLRARVEEMLAVRLAQGGIMPADAESIRLLMDEVDRLRALASPATGDSRPVHYIAEPGPGGWRVRRHDGIVYAGATEDEARHKAAALNEAATGDSRQSEGLDRRIVALYFLGPFGREAGWTTERDLAWVVALARADHFISEYGLHAAAAPKEEPRG